MHSGKLLVADSDPFRDELLIGVSSPGNSTR